MYEVQSLEIIWNYISLCYSIDIIIAFCFFSILFTCTIKCNLALFGCGLCLYTEIMFLHRFKNMHMFYVLLIQKMKLKFKLFNSKSNLISLFELVNFIIYFLFVSWIYLYFLVNVPLNVSLLFFIFGSVYIQNIFDH